MASEKKNTKSQNNGTENTASASSKPKCGIIMPISQIEDCTVEHWADVLSILKETITDAGFEVDLVSNATDVGIIHKRIVQNIFNSDIIVCDVSCKNPNVMFELGMRLAFDKATIIIKDDKTNYSFDTSPIEHLQYPRDLRFNKILSFREELKNKVTATLKKSKEDPEYSTFLKSFGDFKVASITTEEVPFQSYIMQVLDEMNKNITWLMNKESPKVRNLFTDSLSKKQYVPDPYYGDKTGFIYKYLVVYGVKHGFGVDTKAIANNPEAREGFIKYALENYYPEIKNLFMTEDNFREIAYDCFEASK